MKLLCKILGHKYEHTKSARWRYKDSDDFKFSMFHECNRCKRIKINSIIFYPTGEWKWIDDGLFTREPNKFGILEHKNKENDS